MPVVEALSPHVRVSIDTTKEPVAEAAVAVGATLVNDVSASLWPARPAAGCGWVAMHRKGTPATMQDDPRYDDVVAEVRDLLADRAAWAADAGVREIWIDPGIGFGKTLDHNLELLAGLEAAGGHRVAGAGRDQPQGLPGGAGGRPGRRRRRRPDQRLPGSLATATYALHRGAGMVRVHDVAATVQAALLVGRLQAAARGAGSMRETEVGA